MRSDMVREFVVAQECPSTVDIFEIGRLSHLRSRRSSLPVRFCTTERAQTEVVLLYVLYRAVRVKKGRVGTESTNDLARLGVPGAEWFDHMSRNRFVLMHPLISFEDCLEVWQELSVDYFNELSLNFEIVSGVDGIVKLAGGRLVGRRLTEGSHSTWLSVRALID